MGMMDRDYMRDPDRKNPFTPSPKKTAVGWLFKVMVFVTIIYFGFKFAAWLDVKRSTAPERGLTRTEQAASAKSSARLTAVEPTAIEKLPQQTTTSPASPSSPMDQTVVTKCVVNGKVSYGDSACPVGAVTSSLAINNNQNLIAAVQVPVASQAIEIESPLPIRVQTYPGANYAPVKAQCAALEERIKYLDGLARQPQSGQTQDWIRGERSQARDKQFSLKCA